tara:strand:- start:216 stop:425 length:210 start_codon:yes stop_codon:yes gene_type:complete
MSKVKDKDLFWDLIEIGVVSTLISLPVGLYLIPKFKDKPWVPALALTGIGYYVKHRMIAHEDTKLKEMR